MSTYRLAQLLQPSSVALVGASPRERSLGRKVLANLRSGGFAGQIFLVNPKHPEVDGVASVPSLSALPSPPDLDPHLLTSWLSPLRRWRCHRLFAPQARSAVQQR